MKSLSLQPFNPVFPREYLRLLFLNLVNLEELKIYCFGTSNEDSETNKNITIANMTNLRKIDLSLLFDCPEIEFVHLAKLKNLVDIRYYRCKIEVQN